MKAKIRKVKKRRITFSRMGLIYILSMTVAELHQSGLFGWYYLTAILIGVFWAGVGLMYYLRRDKQKYSFFQIKQVVIMLVAPWIIFWIYNIFIYLLGVGHQPYIKSSFVQIMFTPCILMGAFGSYFIFEKRTLRYFLYSIVLSYLITLSILMLKMKPHRFLLGVLGVFSGNSVDNPFEQNSDLVLALGLLVVFYYNSYIRNRTSEVNHAFVMLLLVLLGGKRIEILGLAIIFVANEFTKLMPERKRSKLQIFVSLMFFVGIFTFVFLVISGLMSQYIYSHGINAMGRMKMWDYVAQYAQFNPLYLGKGYSFSNLLLENNKVLTYNGKVYVLHSDILKIFYDLGFMMFTYWGIYNLFVLPRIFRKKFGYEIASLVWSLILFLFVLYLTDNAINYFITQTVFVIIILQSIALNSEGRKRALN